MKYLKVFDSNPEYSQFKSSSQYIEPNLSLVLSENRVMFNDVDPVLSFRVEGNGSVTIKLRKYYGISFSSGDHTTEVDEFANGCSVSDLNAFLQYSTDGLIWHDYEFATELTELAHTSLIYRAEACGQEIVLQCLLKRNTIILS